MYALNYHKPTSVDEAKRLLASMPDAKLLSGGQTLIPTLKQRLASPTDLIDIGKLEELRGVSINGDIVRIGAATRHAEVASSADIARSIPGLAELAHLIGDPHVRNMGTIGGSIANNDPASDYPGALLGLDADVHTTERVIKADQFFTGMFSTALGEAEFVTAVAFRKPRRAAYAKFRNAASRYAVAGAFVAQFADGSVRVAITGAAPCAYRSTAHEAALSRSFALDAIHGIPVEAADLNADMHASAEYRAQLVSVMIEEALAKCLARAT